MTHSVLFVAAKPATDSAGRANQRQQFAWGEFLTRAQQRELPTKGVLRLAENVWLLNLEVSVAPLGWLVTAAEERQIAYGLLPLQHAPQWLPGNLKIETIQMKDHL